MRWPARRSLLHHKQRPEEVWGLGRNAGRIMIGEAPNPSKPHLVRDAFRFLSSANEHQLELAKARYTYAYARRDAAFDKLRYGLVLLTTASLLAVLTALGNDTVRSGKFGLTIADLAFSASAFALGSILAAVAIWHENIRMQGELSDHFVRLSRYEDLRAILDSELTKESVARCEELMAAAHKVPPRDFEHSKLEVYATNWAGATWIAGVSVVIWRVASLIDWCG